VLQALETTVTTANFPVIATLDPLIGLKHLHEQRVSVVIADQRMDAMSGLELLGHARNLQPHASRILITGLLSVKMLTEAVNCGEIYRFIAKPWSTPELLSTVHNAVHRYELLCENAALQAETQKLNNQLCEEKLALESRVQRLTQQNNELERALERVRAVRGDIFEFCDAVLSAFDGSLATRTRRTVEICRQLADAASLPAELRDNLIAAAWFHDLGLIAISRDTDPQQGHDVGHATLRDHPAISERFVIAAGLGEALGAAVRGHHESFDGGGFPDRLRGRQIPEVARWLTPAAYFVSCGLDRQSAIEEMERLSGVAFDPHVVPYLLQIALRAPSPGAITVAGAAGQAQFAEVGHRPSARPGQQLRFS